MLALRILRLLGRRRGKIRGLSMLPRYQPGMKYTVNHKAKVEVGRVMKIIVSPDWQLPSYDFIIKEIEKVDPDTGYVWAVGTNKLHSTDSNDKLIGWIDPQYIVGEVILCGL